MRLINTLLSFAFLSALAFSGLAHAATATEQAAASGIRACLPAIEKVEVYLKGRQATDAIAFWSNPDADKNLFSALIAQEDNESNNFVSLNAVPSPDGQCVVEYTQTGYVPQICGEYLKTLGGQLRFVRDLGKKTALFQGQGVQILFANAGRGCVWMRKEIVKLPQLVAQVPANNSAKPTKPKK